MCTSKFAGRIWLKRVLGLAVVAASFISLGGHAAESKRPNIILIVGDDMGFSDLGCYGGEIDTPNLNRLAAEGVQFTQFYNGARCCPTRAALMTGVYPHQTGIGHMMQDLGRPGYRGELNDQCVTIAEALKAGGYHTLMAGKWHLCHVQFHGKSQVNFENPPGFWQNKNGWPTQRGFERFYGTIHGVNSYYDPFSLVREETPVKPDSKDFYYTDVLTKQAVAYLDEYAKKKEPFFMYLAYTAPHWPLQALPEDIAKYEKKYLTGWDEVRSARYKRLVDAGIIDKEWEKAARDPRNPAWTDAKNKEWEAHRMAVYAAMVDRMDQGIGKVMKRLNELGVDKNTLVIFLSDNGGCAENLAPGFYDIPSRTRDGRQIKVGNDDPSVMAGGDESWQSYGPRWANASNTPFRRYKHWVHEGGISAPCIMYWPDGLGKQKNHLITKPAHVIDIMPTCLDVAGADYPKKFKGKEIVPTEGVSLRGLITGGKLPERTLYWEHEGNRAVRDGKWKLVAVNKGEWELYDMEADRTELHNLASAQPEKVKELSQKYDTWAKHAGVEPWSEISARERAAIK